MTWGDLANKPVSRMARAFGATLALALCAVAAGPAKAQSRDRASTAATAQAVVVAPLALVANQGLNFGLIAPGPAAGTVTLNPDTLACTTTGPIVRVRTCQPAEFTGMGTRRMRVRIQIPTTITLTGPGGATMLVDNVSLDTTPDLVFVGGNGNGLNNGNRRYEIGPDSGVFTFRVGGRLNVGANQTGGVYNGTFSVLAQYQ